MKKILLIILCILMSVSLIYGTVTKTTNLELSKPASEDETVDWFDTMNDNLDLIDAAFDDVLEFDDGERIEDRAGAMWTGNTETFITLTYQDADNTIDAVVPVKDEDNMASDSATHLATQQSIKAYADSVVATLTEEEVEDFVGGMLGGTETLISVDYQDETNDIDFVVTIPEDHLTATMLKDDNAPADEDIFCYESTGTTGHWYSRAEVGIGTATSITDGLIIEADLNADEEPADNDILTFDTTGANFSWQTPSEIITAGNAIAWDSTTLNVTLRTEAEVEDWAGGMFTGNTETRCTVTYQEADNTVDVVVDDLDTNLTEEEVEDFVGTMFGGTETNISVTYNDEDNDIDFVVPTADTDTTGVVTDTDWDTFNEKLDDITGESIFDLSDVSADPNADKFAKWDDDPGEIVWADATGFTDLTDFDEQTAFRVFYSDTNGDVTELALGADGTYLESNGVDQIPSFTNPAGAGDMLKATYDADEDDEIDVAGGGTEKASWTQYCIPYLSNTTVFGEIPIGTAEYALTVAAGATGYDWTLFDLSLYYLKTEIDTQGELETIWGDTLMNDLVDDTSPDLGGELDAGAHSIGFTLQEFTAVDDTTTIDWTLGNKFEFTFDDENQTFTFTPPTNPCNLMLWLIQDETGSRTITWPETCRWPNGTEGTLSTAGGSVDIVGIAWNGTNYDCVINKAFAVP